MKHWIVLLCALSLVGCGGTISFRREDLAFLVEDQKARYNEAASNTNEACEKGALSFARCAKAKADGETASQSYADLRAKILKHDSFDSDAIVAFLLKIGSAVANAYGIPIPSPQGVTGPMARPAPPLMPLIQ